MLAILKHYAATKTNPSDMLELDEEPDSDSVFDSTPRRDAEVEE